MRRLYLFVLLIALGASACSDAEPEAIPIPPNAPSAALAPSSTGAVPTSVAAAPATPETTVADPDGVLAAWDDMWTTAATGGDLEVAQYSASAAETLASRFARGIAEDWQSNAYIEEESTRSAVVHDCFYSNVPSEFGSNTGWYTGYLERGPDGGWQIARLEETRLLGCVPTVLAADVYSAYETYWTTRQTVFAAPELSDDLARVALDDHLAELEGIARALADDDLIERGDAQRSPEIVSMVSPRTMRVRDCQILDASGGRFTAADERVGEPPEARQRDQLDVLMLLEEGTWQVARVERLANVPCDRAPTAAAVPEVGP